MDEKHKQALDFFKDVLREKGSILDDDAIDEAKKGFITMSDDDLLLRMAITFGKFGLFVRSHDDVMKAYGAAVAHFLAEEEAKARNLYP